MPKTLKQLCEKDPELGASIQETLLQMGHHLIGEHIIDRTTAKRIERTAEMSAAHYIAERIYNAVILENGETFEEFLDSLAEHNSQILQYASTKVPQEEYAFSQ